MKKTVIIFLGLVILCLALLISASAEGGDSVGVSSLTLHSYPDKTVYGAFEELDPTGLSLRAVMDNGEVRIIDGADARVVYRQGECFRVGDDSVSIFYGSKCIKLPITVNRISYDLDALKLSGFSTVYNGEYQSYAQLIPRVVGLDGIPLRVNAVGGGINAGSYDISIDFATDSRDYLIPESRVITMTILPANAEVCWGELSFVYDGKTKLPVAYYTDAMGAHVYPRVTGAATNAGEGYIARVTSSDQNYQLTNTSASFEIRRADYDFSSVSWSEDSFMYDGSKKSISITGLPAGVSVTGYSGDRGSNAGIYTAVAMLSWDEQNYNPPGTLSHTWEILKADYDMSGVEFRSDSFVFDGEMHYPTLIGNMPIGADGIALEYGFSDGASHVDDGRVSVTVSFSSSSQNYNIPPDMYSSVSVTPMPITIEWGEVSLEYSGVEQTPMAYTDKCVLTVSGGGLIVGKYIATAATDNTDYTITNPTAEYSIIRAENYWSAQPKDSVCYEGRDIILAGEAAFGNAEYSFYSDAECKTPIDAPTSCGKYYAIISVGATDNYSGLTSKPIGLEIVEIRPVSFLGTILTDSFCAFDTLSHSDIVCSVVNNDGSVEIIDPSLISIIYENGSSLRRGDKAVILRYDSFSLSLPISVDYADYDMSSVGWEQTRAVYDGEVKLPTVTGLPEGVRVSKLIYEGNVNAGKYTVSAILDYDRENYNEPTLPPCEMEILKYPVESVTVSMVYNGKELIPLSSDERYLLVSNAQYTDVGRYSVTAELTDPKNYVFKDSGASVTEMVLEIVPAKISVSVSDVSLMLFEELGAVDYTITSGGAFGDDYVGVSAYIKDGGVYLRSENPNYVLEVTPGRINRLPYPTFEGAVIILCTVFVMLAVFIAALRVYRNRDRLVSAAAMLRCRWHNRDFDTNIPRVETNAATEPYGDGGAGEYEGDVDLGGFQIDVEKADGLITDSLAKSLIRREGDTVYTEGSGRAILSIDRIANAFSSGDRVDINSLKERGLVSEDCAYLKVIGGGAIDKPLTVLANDFSLSAVKMIALSGGQAIKVLTSRERPLDEKE